MNKELICAAILAGGQSTRMGERKDQLQLGNQTVIELISNRLSVITDKIVINRNDSLNSSYPVIQDKYFDAGPLGGLHAVMSEREESWFLLSACDTPFIEPELYEYLLSQASERVQAVIPVFDGRMHPLSGLYHKSLLERITALLSSGERKVRRLFEGIQVNYVGDFGNIETETLANHFFNMNTKMDYFTAKQILKKSEHSRHMD